MVANVKSRKFLRNKDLNDFIQRLLDYGELFAPTREDKVVSLRTVTSPDEVEKDFMQTSNNLRSIIEPQNEILLNFKDTLTPSITERLPTENVRIALWCRPCDARALKSLDDTFNDEHFPDPYYQRRRSSTLLIGLGCNQPFPFCFCSSVGGSPFGTENLDVLMTHITDGYMFESLTDDGLRLEKHLGKLLQEPEKKAIAKMDKIQKTAEQLLPRRAPETNHGSEAMNKIFEAPFWKKWGDKCIGCGICTYLCPTCWCFDITDIETRGIGYRIRTWDSCQFPLFTLHSSGHNPRPDKGSRVRQRVMHKYVYHPSNFNGHIACVGCGRCTELCPMDIDLISILNDLKQVGDAQ